MIGRAALEAALGVPVLGSAADAEAHAAGSAGDAHEALPRVPGSTAQHYAPRTPLRLVPAGTLAAAVAAARAAGLRVATLACPPGTDARAYGRALYATLRALDAERADRLLVEQVPQAPEWDAVRDRLTRAAASA